MKIGFAQINPTVGDLRGNSEKIAAAYQQLARVGADIVIAPELAITGYPPQDLLFKSRFVPGNLEVLDELQKNLSTAALLVGFVDRNQGRGKPFHNAAALLQPGEPLQKTHKSLLPSYDVFNEDRYFEPAREIEPLIFRRRSIGVTICEDIWTEHYLPRPFYDVDPVRALVSQGADMILNVSASPFSLRKPAIRREMICGLAGTYRRPIFYCNAVGGNDQLVFDGNSIAVNGRGQLLAQLPAFEEANMIVDSENAAESKMESTDLVQELFGALRLGLRDYLAKCGFKSAVLGLSGGIDSAVVAAIAVRAL
jgi:NAD+ synthase (glutamine-hydrolysing)